MAIDPMGRLLFGNGLGLLVFDGTWWSKISVPDITAMHVASDQRGRVAVTTLQDFGLLESDQRGTMRYRSLNAELPRHLRGNLGQPALCAAPGVFGIVTERFSATIRDGQVRVLEERPHNGLARRCFMHGERFWVSEPAGLREIGGAITFPGQRVDIRLPDLVIVRGKGMFTPAGEAIDTDASRWLAGKTVMHAQELRDGRIALVTLRHGLLITTPELRIDQLIDARAGLPDELFYDLVQDAQGTLWLALDNSIARVEASTRLTLLDSRVGLRGGVRTIGRHKGVLHVGTSHGVHTIEPGPTAARARRIEGIDTVPWSMLSLEDELLVATYGGIFRLRAGSPPQILAGTEVVLAFVMLRSRRDPSLIWLATSDGVGTLRRAGNTWRFEGLVAGTPVNLWSLAEEGGNLWAGSDVDGLARITPDGKVTRFEGGPAHILTLDDRLVFLREGKGFFELNSHDQLVPDRQLGRIALPPGSSHGAIDASKNVWLASRPPRVIRRLPDGSYESEPRTVGAVEGDPEPFLMDADGVVWIGSERGAYRVAPPIVPLHPQPRPMIRRVALGEQILFENGAARTPVDLPGDFGRLRVEISPITPQPGTSFQYRLEPIDSGWTPWTAQAFLDFTTLGAGRYVFHARTRGAGGEVSEEVTWAFTVLPPWYAARWALLLWTLLAMALVLLIVRLRTRTLRRRAADLQSQVEMQTVALRDSNRQLAHANERLERLSLIDELTRIANRRYFDRALTDEWDRALRREEPLSLIFLDLDHFKELNDTRGHSAGDDCLRHVGEVLQGAIRGSGDVVARYGGEEFAVLLRDAGSDAAVEIAERLRAAIERFGFTASFGTATLAGDATPHDLVERADRALYAAKRAGRNQVQVAR